MQEPSVTVASQQPGASAAFASTRLDDGTILNVARAGATFADALDHRESHQPTWTARRVIWDLSRMCFVDLDLDDLDEIIERIKRKPPPMPDRRAAFVTPTHLGAGMLRIGLLLAERECAVDMRHFRDLDSALEWVRGDGE